MSNKEISKENLNIFNLIAVGAFLYYFLRCLAHLFVIVYKFIGIVSGMEPVVLFWTNKILYIVVMCLALRLWITKMWKQIDLNSINTKQILLKIGIAIVIANVLQFLYGYYVPDFLFENFEKALMSYHEVEKVIDIFGLIDISFSIIGTSILLVLFIKWK